MLPPKCFTCGRIFADIELDYEKKVIELEINKKNLTIEEIKKEKCKILDELHIHRYCCRSRVLTYIDLIKVII